MAQGLQVHTARAEDPSVVPSSHTGCFTLGALTPTPGVQWYFWTPRALYLHAYILTHQYIHIKNKTFVK